MDKARLREIAKQLVDAEEKPLPFGIETFAALKEKVAELRKHNEALRKAVGLFLTKEG